MTLIHTIHNTRSHNTQHSFNTIHNTCSNNTQHSFNTIHNTCSNNTQHSFNTIHNTCSNNTQHLFKQYTILVQTIHNIVQTQYLSKNNTWHLFKQYTILVQTIHNIVQTQHSPHCSNTTLTTLCKHKSLISYHMPRTHSPQGRSSINKKFVKFGSPICGLPNILH